MESVDLVFVGTKNKIEGRIVPQLGYKFRSIWIGGFSRKFRLSNFMLPLKIVVSVFQSLKLLVGFKPQVVVGTGGYVPGRFRGSSHDTNADRPTGAQQLSRRDDENVCTVRARSSFSI